MRLEKIKDIGLHLVLVSCIFYNSAAPALLIDDKGKINSTNVSEVIEIKSEKDILNAITTANTQHLPISIMAVQHSQGGQTLANNAIALNMLGFNKILNLDVKNKQVTVESGIIWSDIQKYINKYNLAVTAMQSPNIFSVGGSVSVNAHGDDFRTGAVGNSIISFRMILANGKKVTVSKSSHPDLWEAARGGYGTLGVITDVTLKLTDNNYLLSHFYETSTDKFINFFTNTILNDESQIFFYAHVNITPGNNFLKDMYVITYSDLHKLSKNIIPLDNPDKWNAILRPSFNISRHGSFGKNIRWKSEKGIFKKIYNEHQVTRNNAMEKPLRFASDYQNKRNVDWLQEYFIPLDKFSQFMNDLRSLAESYKINLLNVTIRFVKKENDILLTYSKNNCFSVVLYFNQDLNAASLENSKRFTNDLINVALASNGSYYLTYQNYATHEQFEIAYPNYKKFVSIKNKYDHKHIFTNKFYSKYLG